MYEIKFIHKLEISPGDGLGIHISIPVCPWRILDLDITAVIGLGNSRWDWDWFIQWSWKLFPAGLQHSVEHFEPMSGIFSSWQLANIPGQISVVILIFLVGHIMCIEPCWTKTSLPDISRSKVDISDIFRHHCLWEVYGPYILLRPTIGLVIVWYIVIYKISVKQLCCLNFQTCKVSLCAFVTNITDQVGGFSQHAGYAR